MESVARRNVITTKLWMQSFRRKVCNQSEDCIYQGDDIHASRDYIRLRRLHANPSDWIKIKRLSKQSLYFLTVRLIFEPCFNKALFQFYNNIGRILLQTTNRFYLLYSLLLKVFPAFHL